MQDKSIAECSKGSILQYCRPFIKLPFGIKILVLSNFELPFYTGFTAFAYQDLQKKREEKREENKQKAEEEIAYLQASGKITKKPFKTGLGKKKIGTKPDMRKNRSDNNINEDTNINTTEDSSPEREKKVTNDDVLEDYYQVNAGIQSGGQEVQPPSPSHP